MYVGWGGCKITLNRKIKWPYNFFKKLNKINHYYNNFKMKLNVSKIQYLCAYDVMIMQKLCDLSENRMSN